MCGLKGTPCVTSQEGVRVLPCAFRAHHPSSSRRPEPEREVAQGAYPDPWCPHRPRTQAWGDSELPSGDRSGGPREARGEHGHRDLWLFGSDVLSLSLVPRIAQDCRRSQRGDPAAPRGLPTCFQTLATSSLGVSRTRLGFTLLNTKRGVGTSRSDLRWHLGGPMPVAERPQTLALPFPRLSLTPRESLKPDAAGRQDVGLVPPRPTAQEEPDASLRLMMLTH